MTTAQMTAIPVENLKDYAYEIACYIEGDISGREVASKELTQWVLNNIDMVSEFGWNTYNGFGIDRKKMTEFDTLTDNILELNIR